MANNIKVSYNIKNYGIKINSLGDKKLLVYIYTKIGNKKVVLHRREMLPNQFYMDGRNFFTEWIVEFFEWSDGKTKKVFTECFNPYNKIAYFYLDPNGTVEEHIEYVKAIRDFSNYWSSSGIVIESIHLSNNDPSFLIIPKISEEQNQNCYVNYMIEKKESSNMSYENYGVSTMLDEQIYFNHIHPYNPETLTPYEFARSIIFKPDYNENLRYLPHNLTLSKLK